MKSNKGKIVEAGSREIYWTTLLFTSDDDKLQSKVLACASLEYLFDVFRIPPENSITKDHLNDWQNSVTNKWATLGDKLFEKDVHYDVFANTSEGERNGLLFLMNRLGG